MAAENTVRYMSEADANWFAQNSRFIAERDKNTQIHNAEKRGREQGERKKAEETATNMIKKKYPASDIAEITGLSLAEVESLQKKFSTN
jgi:predicted transposase/invertase (TIGR01784 family)